MLVARSPGDKVSETCFPDLAIELGRMQCRIGETGLAQQVELLTAQFLAAQLGRINGVRIDQHSRDACAAKHRRGRRTRKSASDDGHVRIPHAYPLRRTPYQCARKDKQTLKATAETGLARRLNRTAMSLEQDRK